MRFFNSSCEISKPVKLKRHAIFRALIALLRDEKYNAKGLSLTDFVETIFYIPVLTQSKNFGALDKNEILQLEICPVPNPILNALVSEKLAKTFGDLSVCGCFFQIEGYWRLDVAEKLCRNGLLLPRRDRNGLIYGLQVYRYADDPKPFLLKLRGVNCG
ncbi:MAG TPA: hypothetical protein VNI60_00170 [Pyrinomonadaceae bacterium]|nr:hypothetical protein [Pyrinomonadaceae bacterium]